MKGGVKRVLGFRFWVLLYKDLEASFKYYKEGTVKTIKQYNEYLFINYICSDNNLNLIQININNNDINIIESSYYYDSGNKLYKFINNNDILIIYYNKFNIYVLVNKIPINIKLINENKLTKLYGLKYNENNTDNINTTYLLIDNNNNISYFLILDNNELYFYQNIDATFYFNSFNKEINQLAVSEKLILHKNIFLNDNNYYLEEIIKFKMIYPQIQFILIKDNKFILIYTQIDSIISIEIYLALIKTCIYDNFSSNKYSDSTFIKCSDNSYLNIGHYIYNDEKKIMIIKNM